MALRTFLESEVVKASSGTVPYLRRLVAGFLARRSRFEPRSGRVGFVVHKVALGVGFLRVLRFPC
jgi:hypothetical protein